MLLSLVICLGLMFALLQSANSSLAEKTAVIESMRIEAERFKVESDAKAKEISDEFTLLVEEVKSKDTALQAARARFGS